MLSSARLIHAVVFRFPLRLKRCQILLQSSVGLLVLSPISPLSLLDIKLHTWISRTSRQTVQSQTGFLLSLRICLPSRHLDTIYIMRLEVIPAYEILPLGISFMGLLWYSCEFKWFAIIYMCSRIGGLPGVELSSQLGFHPNEGIRWVTHDTSVSLNWSISVHPTANPSGGSHLRPLLYL